MIVTQDIIISLDANNTATISVSDIDGGTTDDCGLTSLTIDQMAFDCSHIGTQTVTLTAMDTGGNTAIGTATVTIQDTLLPTVMTQDITLNLDASGTASISTMDVDNGSSDNCGITNMVLDIMQFDCSNLGMNTVTLTVADQSGNIQTAIATVNVVDDIAPTIVTNNSTIYLDANGMAMITAADIVTITDNCDIDSVALGLTQFDCSDVGMNLVSVQVTDLAGNAAMASALVIVADTLPTMINCPGPLSAFACDSSVVIIFDSPTIIGTCDATGTPMLVSGLPSGSEFPIGTTTNTYSYTDANGNSLTCSCLLYTSPSPRDATLSRMPSSA